MSLKDDLIQGAVQKVKNVASSIGNYFNPTSNNGNNFILNNPVSRGISNFMTDLPANSAYIKNQVNKFVMPKSEFSYDAAWNKPTKQEELVSLLHKPTEKSFSAQRQSYAVPVDDARNRFVEAEKQKAINSANYRPAMKRYLSSVPIFAVEPNQEFGGLYDSGNETSPPNTSWEESTGPWNPAIIQPLSKTANLDKFKENDSYAQDVLKHELAHASQPARNTAFNKDFDKFFKSITPESSPMLYQTGLKYFDDGRPAPNAEEFYATIAQNIGPDVLNIPEIRKYYENMFNQPIIQPIRIAPSGGSFSGVTNQKVRK